PDTKTSTRSAGYDPPLALSKGWNGYTDCFRGGPRLLRGPAEAGRGDVRGRPGRADARLRSGAGRGDPADGRPRLPRRTPPRALRGRGRRASDPGAGEDSRPGRAGDSRREGNGPAASDEQGESGRAGRSGRP